MQDGTQNPNPDPQPQAPQPAPADVAAPPPADPAPAAPPVEAQPAAAPAPQAPYAAAAPAPEAQTAYPPPGQAYPQAPYPPQDASAAAPGYAPPQAQQWQAPPGYNPAAGQYAQPGYAPPGGYAPQYGQPGGYAGQPAGYYQPPAAGYAQPAPPGGGYARSEEWEKFRDEFTKIDFDKVIPLGAWIKDKPWNLVWVRWFILYAVFPFILLTGSTTLGLETAAWGFGIYFAMTWIIVLTLCIKPERLELPLLAGTGIFTAVVGIFLVLFAQKLPIISYLYSLSDSPNIVARLLGFVFGVGVIEETCKALPLLIFLYRKKDYRPLTFAYVGAVSGFAFGVKEAVGYSHMYAAGLANDGIQALGLYITVQLLRLISLPLLHGCWSGIVGYFVGLANRHQTAPRALIVTGLAVSIVLHGLYDTFSNGWTGVVLAALTVLIFLSYIRSGDVISKEILAQEVGTTPESAGAVPTAAGSA